MSDKCNRALFTSPATRFPLAEQPCSSADSASTMACSPLAATVSSAAGPTQIHTNSFGCCTQPISPYLRELL